jgi:hypothetical protein
MAVTQFSKLVRRTVLTDKGCLEWTGSNNGSGYGEVRIGGRKRYAHRLAYEAKVGPIADGQVIDHLCRNRACINPLHIEAVGQHINVRRGDKGGSVSEDGSFRCRKCGSADGVAKPDKRASGGFGMRCAPCTRAYSLAYSRANRDALNEKKRAARAAGKAT